MELVYVDIYDKYFDIDKNLKSYKHRYAMTFVIDKSFEYFKNKIYTFFMNNKIDGLEIITVSTTDKHYIDICLPIGKEKKYELYFIKAYLEEEYDLNNVITYVKNETIKNNSSNIEYIPTTLCGKQLILIDGCTSTDFLDKINKNITNNICNITAISKVSYSGIEESKSRLIITLKYNIEDNLIETVLKNSLNENIIIRTCSIDVLKLRSYIVQHSKEQINNLYIYYFNRLDKKTISILMRSRYNEYELKYKNSGDIIIYKKNSPL